MNLDLTSRSLRALLACALVMPAAAFAQTNFNVRFDDPNGTYAAYYADVTKSIVAAGNEWVSRMPGVLPATTLDVLVNFGADIQTLNGTTGDWTYIDTRDNIYTYQAGALYKLATGIDSNGANADIKFGIGTNYLQNLLWYGSAPDPVPNNKVDAVSALAHEFGHAWGFNSFNDWTTGVSFPGYEDYQTTFDYYQVNLSGEANGTLYFTGPNASALYGGAVPLTYGNATHLGNFAPRDGGDLTNDLMNGVAFGAGRRYAVSDLDIAVLTDLMPGLLAPVPEPASMQLLLAGLLGGGVLWRRRRARDAA